MSMFEQSKLWPSRPIKRKANAAATLLAIFLNVILFTSQADAGTFEVWTCRAPDGSPAGTQDPQNGWRAQFANASPDGGSTARDECSRGGALSLAHGDTFSQPTPSNAAWIFFSPPGTSIKRYTLDLDGYARVPVAPSQVYGEVAVNDNLQVDPQYAARFYGTGLISRQLVGNAPDSARYVSVRAGCGDNSPTAQRCEPRSEGAAARVNVYRATFVLEDRDAPAVTSVSGDATTDSLWAGSTGISVGATDEGSGAYRLGVEVDGQVRSWQYLAGVPCRPWTGTERTFLAPKPCPSTVGGSQQISTADLPDGVHTVRVLVEDAAGNQTTAYGPVTKTLRRTAEGTPAPGGGGSVGGSTTDPGPLNGSPAVSDARIRARWTGRESPTRSIRFNQRPKLDGQLTTPAGQPIRDAFVRVTITRDARNSPPFTRDSLRTDRNGRFRWTLPTGVSSRSIRLTYHQRVNDATPVASTRLTLRVVAGVRMSLSRKTARKGQAVRISGKVLGRPMPKAGKLVELQARNPGRRWITFRTVRSRKSGSFAATYRFRNGGPARFQMRARVRKTGDYPYATGASPVRSIRIR